MVVSHEHLDHAGGAESVSRLVPPARVMRGAAPEGDAGACRSGRQWRWDAVGFAILHQDRSKGLTQNDRSCVLRIAAGGRRMLLTGDIERTAERRMLERYGSDALRAEVMLMPHHGSDTSSGGELLERVAPRMAIYSAGRDNRFGHPAPAVLRRYAARGAAVLGTPDSGAITLRLSGANPGLPSRRYREQPRRYWHRWAE